VSILKKTAIIVGLLCIGLVVSSFYFMRKKPVEHEYNMNPDVSQKIVGSKSLDPIATMIAFRSLQDITSMADLIVIGRVTTDGELHTEEFNFENAKLKEKALWDSTQSIHYSVSYSQVKVEKVLYGSLRGRTITLAQLGKPDNNNGETKVKKGDRMLFILRKDPNTNNLCSSVDFERGLFTINKDNKLLSLSDDKVVAKYDGIDLSVLIDDIKNATKK
jgi:hypothetical protein